MLQLYVFLAKMSHIKTCFGRARSVASIRCWHPELILVWQFCSLCSPRIPHLTFLGIVLLANLLQIGLCRGHLKKKWRLFSGTTVLWDEPLHIHTPHSPFHFFRVQIRNSWISRRNWRVVGATPSFMPLDSFRIGGTSSLNGHCFPEGFRSLQHR